MKTIDIIYTLTLEGNDIDAKQAQKMEKGQPLVLKRIQDEEDTFEIVVCTAQGKEIEMLSYEESLGVAPFLDNQEISLATASLQDVTLTQGKSRANDITTLTVCVSYQYNSAMLTPFYSADGVFGFMPANNRILSMALYCLLDYHMPVIMQTYLNKYEMDIDLDADSKPLFDFSFDPDLDYFFHADILFDAQFTRCKATAWVYDHQENRWELSLTQSECESLLELINHYRIFQGEEALDCPIEE